MWGSVLRCRGTEGDEERCGEVCWGYGGVRTGVGKCFEV